MGAGSGLATQLTAPVAETTYGVVPAGLASTTKFSAFKGETLELKKTTVQGEGLFAGKLHPMAARRVVTEYATAGGVTMDLPARGLQQWLYPMLGSWGQTAATLTQDVSTGAYKAVHAPGLLKGNSFCVQKGVPAIDGTVEPFTYVGQKITEWELSCQKAAIAQLAITMDGRNELAGAGNGDPLNVSVPGLVPYVQPPAGGVFVFAQATLYLGGTCSTSSGVTSISSPVVAGNIREASVKYAMPVNADRVFMGSAGFKSDQLDNALRPITGQFVVEWLSSEARYNAFAADTPTPLELQFIGPAIGSGSDFSTLSILIPDIFLEGETPKVGGPDVVTQTVPFTGLDDGTNNPIQVTYWTLDTA